MNGASDLLIRPSTATNSAIRLPEVLACIISWLSNDKRAIRSVRLVSTQFRAVANQFFRIHLHADYAIKHNCIQEAAFIVGGLTVTFRDAKSPFNQYPQSMDDTDDWDPEEPPEAILIDTAFCALVAQTCVHLEKLVIELEGSNTVQMSTLLSALFSQNLEKAAVFRIRNLQLVLTSNFAQSVMYAVSQVQLHEATSSLLWTTPPKYAPDKSSLAQLETLTLQMSFLRGNSDIYKILQLKLCPEITIATSFLGPAFIINPKDISPRTDLVKEAPSMPSKTFRTLECFTMGLNIDQIFRLKEQAPAFEGLRIWEIINFDRTKDATSAFEHASTRPAGSLNLKQLRLMRCTGRYASLLLGRLLNPATLESFSVSCLYPSTIVEPEVADEHRGGTLKEIMTEMREGQLSKWDQWRPMREFGIKKLGNSIEPIDWLQELRAIPRFSRLEKITLPISVHDFVEMFINKLDPAETKPTGGEEPTMNDGSSSPSSSSSSSRPSMAPELPFPACSSLLSIHLSGSSPQTIDSDDVLRFANFLTRWVPQLQHLDIQKSCFVDLDFLDAIAPRPKPLPPSPSSMSLAPGSVVTGSTGLCQLESLAISFEFLSRGEFSNLPRSEHLKELQDKKASVVARGLHYSRGPTGTFEYNEIEKSIRIEEHRMILESRPIQVHEDRVDRILTFLDQFQMTSEDRRDVEEVMWPLISGLKEMSFTQLGMPKQFQKKLEHQVQTLFPEVKWMSFNNILRLPDRASSRT